MGIHGDSCGTPWGFMGTHVGLMDQKVSSGGFRTQDTINSCYDQVYLELEAQQGLFWALCGHFRLSEFKPLIGTFFLHMTKPQKELQRSSSDP